MSVTVKIGVLNVQGAVSEHAIHVGKVGAEPVLVKHADDLTGLHGLILPGGESTTIGKLIRKYGLFEPIIEASQQGLPIFGTCAGMILLAKQIEGFEEPHLALMDVLVNRNSFGRQRDSFEADIFVEGMNQDPFPAVFIRAPHVVKAGQGVQILAALDDRIVAVRENHLLATAFHPELTDDLRMHQYFKQMAESYQAK